MAKMQLGYWEIRGLAQPIRFLLEHVSADYEEKRYYNGPAPDYDKSDWFNVKTKLNLDFPNIPYLIDGDVRLTQSELIMRYLARKFNLVGNNQTEQLRCELAERQIADVRSMLVMLSYMPNPEHSERKAFAIEKFRENLRDFSKFLGERDWMAGNQLTYADFLCYETFFQLSVLDKESFEGKENLLAYTKRFEELPAIAAYMKSDKYIKWPFNNNKATFGSRSDPCPF